MKNLGLFQHFRYHIENLSEVKCFCVDANSQNLYIFGGDSIYKLSTKLSKFVLLVNLNDYYNTTIPDIRNINFNPLSEVLCLAFQNGDVLTLESDSKELQCVGCVGSGLKAVEWSPDQEVVAMVTGQDTVIIMTGDYDPLVEVDVNQNSFGEKQFITVGWGKKETQFHGSEGKVAACSVSSSLGEISHLDNKQVYVSWRGDGSLFAVNMVNSEVNARQIRIFSRDGVLQYTSELASGLEGALAWRQSGNLIAASQRLSNKHVVALFEKNGLRHGEFSLPFTANECKVHLLTWNCESTILAVWCEDVVSDMYLQLWTINNYHWYMKQCLNFSNGKKLLGLEWDTLKGNRLHVICEGIFYICYDWTWSIDRSLGKTEHDGAFVTVIDGDKILVTSFRHGVIPPPLCNQTVQLTSPVNNIIFSSHELRDNFSQVTGSIIEDTVPKIDSNAFCALLNDGTLAIFGWSPLNSCHTQLGLCKFEVENVTDLHNWLWIKSDTLLCCCTRGEVSYLMELMLDLNTGKINVQNEICAGGLVTSIVGALKDSEAVIQLMDATTVIYKLGGNTLVQHEKSLPEACEFQQICHIDGKDVLLGLNSHNRFYVDGKEVADNVTSLVVHSQFILLTTLKHMLLCIHLNTKGLQCLMERNYDSGRRIERGARLVTAVAGDTRVILQMPRGNLECIQPRPLTLHVAALYLDSRHYGEAFKLLRKQRINLNLLCDYHPTQFIANIDTFVNELGDPMWLSLFLSELQDDNVTHIMYGEYYSYLEHLPNKLNNKVNAICDSVREAILRRQDADRYLLPVLTSHVQKQTDNDIADALLRIKEVKEAEKNNRSSVISADDALKYLLYLVDVNRLFDIALGLYDFDLVMLVAAKSNKDPKEYLSFLNDLRRMEHNYRCFSIDKHLKRYISALRHIAICPEEEHFKECLDLIKLHNLYSHALELFPEGSSRYMNVAEIYADNLLEKKVYFEAGIMYKRAKNYDKALTAYKLAGDWREALLAAQQLQYKESKLHDLCQNLVSRLKERHKFNESAEILLKHMGDVEESIAVLVQGRLWDEAVWSSYRNNRLDMIDTDVKPGMLEHFENLSSQITKAQEQFISYRGRLNVVRICKEQHLLDEKDGDIPEECDLYSDTSSVVASTLNTSYSGSKVSGRSGRSSKNRRKQERKMLSLKEGSPYEEFALIRALYQLMSSIYDTTEEVYNLCKVMVRFDKDKEATSLQKLLSDVIQEMDNAKNEIWTPCLHQPQMIFGPDTTVNSITANLQYQNNLNPGLSLLEPLQRFPPQNKFVNWKLSILSTVPA